MSDACCKHTHVPYINSDKTIKESFVVEHFGQESTVETVKEPNPYNTPEKKLRDVQVTYVIKGAERIKLCTCECHITGNGIYVLH